MKYSKTRRLVEIRPPVVDKVFTWATDDIGLTSVASFKWFLESFDSDDVHWQSLGNTGLSIEVKESFANKRLKTIVVLESGLAIVGVSSATLGADSPLFDNSLATDKDVLEKTKEYVAAFENQLEVLRKERQKIWQAKKVEEKLAELNSTAAALRTELEWAIRKISGIRKSYLDARNQELQAKHLEDAHRALAARESELEQGFTNLSRLKNELKSERLEFVQEAHFRSRELDSKKQQLDSIEKALDAREREFHRNSDLQAQFAAQENLQRKLEAEISQFQLLRESWPSLDQAAKNAIFELAARERRRVDRANRLRSASRAMEVYIVKSKEMCTCCNLPPGKCKGPMI